MNLIRGKRFTIDEYHRLAELGFFTEDDRVELIEGEIVQMVAKGTAHSVCNTRLYREILNLVGEQATIRGQEPILISHESEPEPDLVIVENRSDDYLQTHPQPEDIFLLIEVADSSLKYDQEIKLPIYAKAAISNYWIFNLVNNYLECYSNPYQDLQNKFGYRCKLILLPNETVSLPILPDLVLNLSKIFPR
ncbi:Uma2 family endonuclease [Umezakia ovalisporum]|jgi:Uma2 family endonuclease|uniref:Uma2 family endonuclease n=2 Tax=Umezakia ovalisporum TaxID=75695 RepID=A0AA43KEJ6_9CYAN|nr:Uma2 family endonuclease [Umezakia ovalisporum]MDH6055741.1 Uma2 family endonuclease [Umezakia ovalisporum FSS-43]MDH6063656.1 Uma2 family endonuclease [Umezakia ovalisporum FSS-62]MDH6067242.1 Uma2 family endonuclease [Umezakia ovalisporum APH033B]MDH6069786.1 Uma2 family endonuclease [Umezakia ovalisporum CobakiLakeA]MDH6075481.1 Uma2 family endonuclease [Umezakia ovalisporum CS-1034]